MHPRDNAYANTASFGLRGMDHAGREDGPPGRWSDPQDADADTMSASSDASMAWPVGSSARSPPPPPPPPQDVLQHNWHAAHRLEAASPTQEEVWATTLPRRLLVGLCSAMCLVAVVFLVVAHSGSTRATKASMNIYFFRMDLSYVFGNQTASPDGTANPALASTIAQSIGLHDYYQAGLWGFCQGYYYNASGPTSCSRPRAFYWFNPLGILMDEMLPRSTVDLPPRAVAILEAVRIASQAMFGLYFFGAVLALVLALASPLALFSRWYSLPISVLAGATAAPLVMASLIVTALAVAYRVVASSITQLHIVVTMGPAMFGLVWAATGLCAAAFLANAILGCCRTSVRDVKTGLRPFVQLPPASEVSEATSAEQGGEKKAGIASFVPWASVLKKNKGRSISSTRKTKTAPAGMPLSQSVLSRGGQGVLNW